METNINYTLVGAFMITLIAAIVVTIIWLSSGFSLQHYSIYKVYMQESVSGLSVDSTVEYNGVNVGNVKSIELNHQNPHLVELLLDIKSDTPITKGTVATLAQKGLTGIANIALKDNSTNLEPLQTLPGQPYPIIKTAPSLFMRLDTALTDLSRNISEVSASVQKLLNPENQESLKHILANLQSVTANLADNNEHLTNIIENTARASKQFPVLIQSTIGTAKMLETQTLPATYQLLNSLQEMTRNLSAVAYDIKQNPSVLIRGSNPLPLGPGEKK